MEIAKRQTDKSAPPKFAEQHYTVAEISNLWKLSDETVRKLFKKEPGVLVIGNERLGFATREQLYPRIPEFIAVRVHRELPKP